MPCNIYVHNGTDIRSLVAPRACWELASKGWAGGLSGFEENNSVIFITTCFFLILKYGKIKIYRNLFNPGLVTIYPGRVSGLSCIWGKWALRAAESNHGRGPQLDGPFLGSLCPRTGSCGLFQEPLLTGMRARAGTRFTSKLHNLSFFCNGGSPTCLPISPHRENPS